MARPQPAQKVSPVWRSAPQELQCMVAWKLAATLIVHKTLVNKVHAVCATGNLNRKRIDPKKEQRRLSAWETRTHQSVKRKSRRSQSQNLPWGGAYSANPWHNGINKSHLSSRTHAMPAGRRVFRGWKRARPSCP